MLLPGRSAVWRSAVYVVGAGERLAHIRTMHAEAASPVLLRGDPTLGLSLDQPHLHE